jgi:hypothetical protein
MLTIPIQVSGDCWNNRSAVKEQLDQTSPGDSVMLDLCSEGPSLRRLGVIELLEQYNLDVAITRWSNSVEPVPFRLVYCNVNSHFFPMSHHYWVNEIENRSNAEFRFALFQGRGCPSRNRILFDAYHQYRPHFLLSKMQNRIGHSWGFNQLPHHVTCESVSQWFDDFDSAKQWFDNCPVTSIDNHVVQDQFAIPEVSSGDMARSIMQHYPRFNVELVCETYTLGKTFFPTEKTVRPMVGNRPFVVYGPKNYLNNLQQRGFQTFGNVWDESYDRLEGPQRWQAIQQLIDHLVAMSSAEWAQIIHQCKQITKHNRTVVRQIIHDLKGI